MQGTHYSCLSYREVRGKACLGGVLGFKVKSLGVRVRFGG